MKQTSLFGTKRLTYSQADSPVSHIQPQGNDLGKRTSDISGRRCLERLEKLNHVGSLAKTFTVLLVGMKGWSSKRCKLTWKMKGTKSNRIYFQLHPSMLPTEEIESGLLLKTPCAADSYSENLSKKEQKFGNSGTLAQEVQSGFIEKRGIMLPTPTKFDYNSARTPEKFEQDKAKYAEQGVNLQMALKQMARNGMLPTPTASDIIGTPKRMDTIHQTSTGGYYRVSDTTGTKFGAKLNDVAQLLPTPATRDYKGARSTEALQASGRNETNSLPDAFHQPGTSSQLNPLFVEEMMGFPENWTLLPFLNGETKASKPTEMPSSHK